MYFFKKYRVVFLSLVAVIFVGSLVCTIVYDNATGANMYEPGSIPRINLSDGNFVQEFFLSDGTHCIYSGARHTYDIKISCEWERKK